VHRRIQFTRTTSCRRTSPVTWPNDNNAVGTRLPTRIASLPPVVFILARRVAISLLFAAALALVHIALADVTDRGTYTQSIDIDVPPFHSIAPTMRLLYESNSRNGPLGIGWSLQASSQITRTAKPTGVPHYNSVDDQFWLDGMELIPCSVASKSISCRCGGTHTTREESYQRIVQDTHANTWTVWRKDGTQLSYAAALGETSSDGTLRWLLNTVTDTHHNVVSYSYSCDVASSACYLSSISYGAGKTCKISPTTTPPDIPSLPIGSPIPGVNIHFYWESRPDRGWQITDDSRAH
jgi:hypothetical protein